MVLPRDKKATMDRIHAVLFSSAGAQKIVPNMQAIVDGQDNFRFLPAPNNIYWLDEHTHTPIHWNISGAQKYALVRLGNAIKSASLGFYAVQKLNRYASTQQHDWPPYAWEYYFHEFKLNCVKHEMNKTMNMAREGEGGGGVWMCCTHIGICRLSIIIGCANSQRMDR